MKAIDSNGISPELQTGIKALADQMHTQGVERTDPVREIPAMLGDRWTALILLVLDIGRWRHAELRRVLGQLGAEGKISQRVMTLKLRAMERNGLVNRLVTQDVPPKVSYELTEMGHSLCDESRRLIEWTRRHQLCIEQARTLFKADQPLTQPG
jgi:DNA-binding HxlR family transcriptional regulator